MKRITRSSKNTTPADKFPMEDNDVLKELKKRDSKIKNKKNYFENKLEKILTIL
jgi:hypothetical protein